jgi:hypothetical protein
MRIRGVRIAQLRINNIYFMLELNFLSDVKSYLKLLDFSFLGKLGWRLLCVLFSFIAMVGRVTRSFVVLFLFYFYFSICWNLKCRIKMKDRAWTWNTWRPVVARPPDSRTSTSGRIGTGNYFPAKMVGKVFFLLVRGNMYLVDPKSL